MYQRTNGEFLWKVLRNSSVLVTREQVRLIDDLVKMSQGLFTREMRLPSM